MGETSSRSYAAQVLPPLAGIAVAGAATQVADRMVMRGHSVTMARPRHAYLGYALRLRHAPVPRAACAMQSLQGLPAPSCHLPHTPRVSPE